MNTPSNTTPPQMWEQIKKANRILLHCHPNTDGDSVGSVLAVLHMLERVGKKVTAIAGDNAPMPEYLSFLPDYKKIIPKDFFQVNLADFDLFIILDAGSPNQISKKAPISFPLSIPTLVIDHHASNPGFADSNYIDATSPATCQILYELFQIWGVEVDHDMAIGLLIGIYSDTGGFIYEKTTAATFRIASELATLVPEFTKYIFHLHNSNNPGWIAFFGKAFSNVKVWGSGVAITTVSYEEIEKSHIKKDELGGAGSFVGTLLRSVVGWEVTIACTEQESQKVKISFRSRDPQRYDVSKIALEVGGGGHPGAAGASVEGSLEAVVRQIKSAVEHIYPELAKPSK